MATEEDFKRIGNYAVMFQPDQKIDRHKCKRTTPLEVLHMAMSRTGTLSMQKAYQILGYPNPYHFSEIYGNVNDCDMWMEAFRAKYEGQGTFGREQWDQLLGHCGAVTDMPCINFGPELIAAYPEAKVVLVDRDEEKWLKSMDTLFVASTNPIFAALGYTDPFWIARVQQVGFTMYTYLFGTQKLKGLRTRAKGAYDEHYATIRAVTPKERLLEYKLGSGWEPLCEFLGKPVPDVSFPHLNESTSLVKVFEDQAMLSMRRSVVNLLMVLSAMFVPLVGWFFAKRIGRLLE